MTLRKLLLAGIVVSAAACGQDGPTATVADVRFTAAPGAPAAPVIVASTVRLNATVSVDFTHDGVNVARFRLLARTRGVVPWTVVRDVDNVSVRLLADNRYDNRYPATEWTVEACNDAGCTASNVVEQNRLRLYSVSSVEIPFNSVDSVKVRWSDAVNVSQWSYLPGRLGFDFVITRTRDNGDTAQFVVPMVEGQQVYTFTDTGLIPGNIYRYGVQARNRMGPAAIASSPWLRAGGPAAPAATAALRKTGAVVVNWTHDGVGVGLWRVYGRKQGTETWQFQNASSDPRNRSLAARYDVRDETWEWRVDACDRAGSPTVCTPSSPTALSGLRLTEPSNLHVVENVPGRIRIGYTEGSGTGTTWFRWRQEGSYYTGETVASGNPHTDLTASPDYAYYYSAFRMNAMGRTDTTPELRVPPSRGPSAPSVPLAYTDSARNTGFGQFRGLTLYGRAARNFAPVDDYPQAWFEWSTSTEMSAPTRAGAFRLTGDTLNPLKALVELPAGTYYFRMVTSHRDHAPVRGVAQSLNVPPPAAPASLTAVQRSNGYAAISWTHSGAGVNSWKLYRRTRGTTAWTLVVTSFNNVRTIVDSLYGGDPHTQEWRVEACLGPHNCTSSGAVQLP